VLASRAKSSQLTVPIARSLSAAPRNTSRFALREGPDDGGPRTQLGASVHPALACVTRRDGSPPAVARGQRQMRMLTTSPDIERRPGRSPASFSGMSRRRYVARGVPGGYRIWDNKARRWWGEFCEHCPDELLTELNGAGDYAKITALLRHYRAQKR
jgi:hypothetical protein